MKQKVLLMVLALSMCSIGVNAQIKRELQTESNGFQWYKTTNDIMFHGAESKSGNTLIPLSREYIYISFTPHKNLGYFEVVGRGGKSGVCDITGKEIIAPNKYEDVSFQSYENLDYFSVYYNKRSGVCNITGKEIIAPNKYTFVDFCSRGHKGFYKTYIDGAYGACDITGKEVIPCKYRWLDVDETTNQFYYEESPGYEKFYLDVYLDSQGQAYGKDVASSSSSSTISSSRSSSSANSSNTFDFIYNAYQKQNLGKELLHFTPEMPEQTGGLHEYLIRIKLKADVINYSIMIVDRENNDKTELVESYSISPSSSTFTITDGKFWIYSNERNERRGILFVDDNNLNKTVIIGKWDNNGELSEGKIFLPLDFFINYCGTEKRVLMSFHKRFIEKYNKNRTSGQTQAGETDYNGKFNKLKASLERYNWAKRR